jgi:hypothetical protein
MVFKAFPGSWERDGIAPPGGYGDSMIRLICYRLLVLLALLVCPADSGRAGEVQRMGTERPRDRSSVNITTYVPRTTLRDNSEMAVVVEIVNDSDVELTVANQPYCRRIHENELQNTPILNPQPLPDGGAASVLIAIEAAYPQFQGLGNSMRTGQVARTFTRCRAGTTLLLKMQVQRTTFQPGDCSLVVSLRAGGGIERGRDIARADPVPLTIVASRAGDAKGEGRPRSKEPKG